MPDAEEIKQQQTLLGTYRGKLNHYLQQKARLNFRDVSWDLTKSIEETRASIQEINQTLRAWGVTVEDLPSDSESEPLIEPDPSSQNRFKHSMIVLMVGIVLISGLFWVFNQSSSPVAQSTPTIGTNPTFSPVIEATPSITIPITIGIASDSQCSAIFNLEQEIQNIFTDLALPVPIIKSIPLNAASDSDALKQAMIQIGAWINCDQVETIRVGVLVAEPFISIAGLNEPPQAIMTSTKDQINIFFRGMVLSAIGRDDLAYQIINGIVNSGDPNNQDMIQFNWWWGNLLLRLERWEEARKVYRRILSTPTLDPSIQAMLLSNNSLNAVLETRAAASPSPACRDQAHQDIEQAIRLMPEHAEFHAIWALIMLYCPRDTLTSSGGLADIETNASAQLALINNPHHQTSLFHSVKAQIGLANSAIPALGDASLVKNAACTAYQLNPRDAEPHRTLALLYTRHGLIEDAKRELSTYRDRASFAWQKQEATDYLNEIQKPNSGLVGQLDAPLGLGRPCLLEN